MTRKLHQSSKIFLAEKNTLISSDLPVTFEFPCFNVRWSHYSKIKHEIHFKKLIILI